MCIKCMWNLKNEILISNKSNSYSTCLRNKNISLLSAFKMYFSVMYYLQSFFDFRNGKYVTQKALQMSTYFTHAMVFYYSAIVRQKIKFNLLFPMTVENHEIDLKIKTFLHTYYLKNRTVLCLLFIFSDFLLLSDISK